MTSEPGSLLRSVQAAAGVAVYATASGLDTGSQERDAHMCGTDSPDAGRHPLVSFW
ncbi:hypothetical protein AB0I54_47545 [Streptomyces sp. NPDC050625]|uniref:hypothetical protein n=1 Tax=Streptomyces sp. NPDC050625 TaxID=3154629 RepID=UPI00342D2E05